MGFDPQGMQSGIGCFCQPEGAIVPVNSVRLALNLLGPNAVIDVLSVSVRYNAAGIRGGRI